MGLKEWMSEPQVLTGLSARIMIFFLTVFPPTGMLGFNHSAMGNSDIAFAKSLSVVILSMMILFILPYFPSAVQSMFASISVFGPWYMFDILELYNLKKHGFRLPVSIEGLKAPPHQNTELKLSLTPVFFTLLMATILASATVVMAYVPARLIPGNIQTYIQYITGLGGLFVGGVSGVGALLATAGAASGGAAVSASSILSAAAAASTAGVPVPVPVPVSLPKIQSGGSSLPPLSSFSEQLKTDSKESTQESLSFLAILGLVVLGGVTMNMVNSKCRDLIL